MTVGNDCNIAIHVILSFILNSVNYSNSPGQLSELGHEDGEDVTEARERLQEVVDADEAVVAGVRGQIVLLHHIRARGRDGHAVAHAALAEQAELRTGLLAAGARLDAAHLEVSLCGVQSVRKE